MAKHRMLEHPGEEVNFKMKVLAKHISKFEHKHVILKIIPIFH